MSSTMLGAVGDIIRVVRVDKGGTWTRHPKATLTGVSVYVKAPLPMPSVRIELSGDTRSRMTSFTILETGPTTMSDPKGEVFRGPHTSHTDVLIYGAARSSVTPTPSTNPQTRPCALMDRYCVSRGNHWEKGWQWEKVIRQRRAMSTDVYKT